MQSFSVDTFPSSWPTNKRGLPICVVVVWDPNVQTTIDAFLEHKAREARWRPGDAVIPDFRMLLVPCSEDRSEACRNYAQDVCTRAWLKGHLYVGDEINTETTSEHRTHPDTSGAEHRMRPTYKYGAVSSEGIFGILEAPYQVFLDNEITAADALEFAKHIAKTYRSKDSPRWPVTKSASESVSVHDLEVDVEPFQDRKMNLKAPVSLEQMEKEHGPWVVDTVTQDAKIRILINKESRGFGVVLASTTVPKDGIVLLPGSGGPRTKEEADECKANGWFSLTPEVTNDNVSLLYKKDKQDKTPQMYTWYSLRAQLALDGFADVALNGHLTTIKENPGSVGAQRYTVQPVAVKTWCCAHKKRKSDEQLEGTWQTGLAWVHDLTNLPNEVVKIVWMVDMATDPAVVVRFKQPCLCWTQSMALVEGQIFQWA